MLPNTHPAKYPYSIFRRAQESVRNDVVSGLGIRLQVFQNELIRQITGHNEIELTLPGKKKCAYFCITSDQDSTFDFLSSLFMSFVFIKLVRYADEQDGCKLPVPVHILADEIANGGYTIADLTKKISTIRFICFLLPPASGGIKSFLGIILPLFQKINRIDRFPGFS